MAGLPLTSPLGRLTVIGRAEVTGGGLAGLAAAALLIPATALLLEVAGQTERLGLFSRIATLALGVFAAGILGERADSIAWSLPVPLRLRRSLRVFMAVAVVSASWWALMAVAHPGHRLAPTGRWLVDLVPFFLAGVVGAAVASRLGWMAHPEGGAALPALLALVGHFVPAGLAPVLPYGHPGALSRAALAATLLSGAAWAASGEGWGRIFGGRRLQHVSADSTGAPSGSLPKGTPHAQSP
jgi:hypothetical protein